MNKTKKQSKRPAVKRLSQIVFPPFRPCVGFCKELGEAFPQAVYFAMLPRFGTDVRKEQQYWKKPVWILPMLSVFCRCLKESRIKPCRHPTGRARTTVRSAGGFQGKVTGVKAERKRVPRRHKNRNSRTAEKLCRG